MRQVFTVRAEHIELLKNMYVDWNDAENGAPTISPKRPYGNSDLDHDLARLLKKFNSGRSLYDFHVEMKTVLQIYLSMVDQKFREGDYMMLENHNILRWTYIGKYDTITGKEIYE